MFNYSNLQVVTAADVIVAARMWVIWAVLVLICLEILESTRRCVCVCVTVLNDPLFAYCLQTTCNIIWPKHSLILAPPVPFALTSALFTTWAFESIFWKVSFRLCLWACEHSLWAGTAEQLCGWPFCFITTEEIWPDLIWLCVWILI